MRIGTGMHLDSSVVEHYCLDVCIFDQQQKYTNKNKQKTNKQKKLATCVETMTQESLVRAFVSVMSIQRIKKFNMCN